ncbi:acetyl-CoA synthetase-like protein [Lindgomyces ingoldianus]|uniref:Acetyl-CoA synthetase-like protein n=1 Tax=Lindgomyces ingoldianus TaxID=673940 RepID=A0ACB6Q916_9PLEO|nr:acetyl-CoA synthetase-like protein [Lindgomyces ingoldianus]KAF2462852.1 acetyl-CoA synthetase-like protein [Lindgomyces ingoldianus]
MATLQFEEGVNRPQAKASHCRQQLLVNILDGMANVKPNATYAHAPISPVGYDKGFRRITYHRLANAVNGLGWWITAQIGRSASFDTLLYLGPNDIRQTAIIFACIKAGYKCLFTSHRLQLCDTQSLLRSTSCKAILTSDPLGFHIPSIKDGCPLPIYQVPPLNTLLVEDYPSYPYKKPFEQAKHDPFLVLHTSGTSSTPRPMVLKNDWLATYLQSLHAPSPPGFECLESRMRGCRVFVMLTPYHVHGVKSFQGANLDITVFGALTNETPIILPPAEAPVNVQTLIQGLGTIDADVCYVPPHFIEEIANNQKYVEIVTSRASSLVYAAGKVSEAHADIMSAKMEFWGRYGATEQGTVPSLRALGGWDCTMYNYIIPHPTAGWQFRPYSSSNDETIYEAFIVRDVENLKVQPVFTLFEELEEYPTHDLFLAHPRIPGAYKWCGRTDDTISLSTAANVNPMIMEHGLDQHQHIKGVLMIGNGRPRPALLVEPNDCAVSNQSFIDGIWESVEKLNRAYFVDHRILKSYIIVTNERERSSCTRRNCGHCMNHAQIDMLRMSM